MTRNRWSWSARSGRAARLGLPAAAADRLKMLATAAVLVAALPAGPAGAATVLEKSVEIAIRADGTVREHIALRVRIDALDDVGDWRSYPIYLDENRALVSAEGSVLQPDGKREKVGRRDRDAWDADGGGIFHSSAKYHVLEFGGLRVGSVVAIDSVVEGRPYFPAGQVSLRGGEAVERLRVEVAGGGAGWRWRLDGPADGLEIEEGPGRVGVTAEGLPRLDPPELTPPTAVRPVLRFGWGDDPSWDAVGRWATDLFRPLARATPAVRTRARELTAGLDDPRARLEALTDFVQREIRYVAVEIGIGGYRPSPPDEVLDRKWGDCKDKAMLLIDLLVEAGVPARPAMILADPDRRIDRDFPTPFVFNHMIVAVPAEAVAAREGDATSGGYLFVDPTQGRGGARWLSPFTQDQDALVVAGDGGDGEGTAGGVLVHTPTFAGRERRRLAVNLHVNPEGDAVGGAGLEIAGDLAAGLLGRATSEAPQWMEARVRSTFSHLLPGVTAPKIGWSEVPGEVPTLSMSAAVRLPAFLQGTATRYSFQLPGLSATPAPDVLAGRELAAVVTPKSVEATWTINLPAGCRPPDDDEQGIANPVGSFRQTVRGDGGRMTVVRSAEVHRRWIEREELPALSELALAEHRAQRRRLRIECGELEPAHPPR